MALTAGVTGFGTMLHATAETLTAGLESALDHRVELVRHDVDTERTKVRIIASDAMIARALHTPGEESRREAATVLHGAVHDHYRQLLLVDRQTEWSPKPGMRPKPKCRSRSRTKPGS